jgi:hypothetical protein
MFAKDHQIDATSMWLEIWEHLYVKTTTATFSTSQSGGSGIKNRHNDKPDTIIYLL